MEFNEFLEGKKISVKDFKKGNPEQFASFEEIFMQMHPESFTAQKLFLINQIRRKYPFKAAETSSDKNESTSATAKPKAKMRPTSAAKPRPKPKPKI